jgi:hypothetical protein
MIDIGVAAPERRSLMKGFELSQHTPLLWWL